MMFISSCVYPAAEGRMLRFLLLVFVLLEATAGLAVAQSPQEEAAARLRADALRERAKLELIQQQQRNIQLVQLRQRNAEQLRAEQYYLVIFQQDRTPEAARQRLETSLSYEVAEIDRTCTLSPAQKHKLLLMGRGDIKRFFDRCETLKERFLAYGRNDEEINEDLYSLQIILRSGLFQVDSLLHKSLSNALTGEQSAQYGTLIRDRLQSRHETAIKQTVTILEQGSRFSEAERQKLIALLKKEIRPARISGDYDVYYILGQLHRLPEEKVKPLLNEEQRFRLVEYKAVSRQIEPRLRKAGYFRDQDDEEEKRDGPAAPSKK